MDNIIKKAGVLIEAIPYIHAFRGKIFVIKYGGSILDDHKIRRGVLEDIVFLSYVGIRAILIHGGGPQISSRLKEIGVKPEFYEGIRVTDKDTLRVVVEELDKLNRQLVNEVKELRGDVTGLKGEENIIHVKKKKAAKDLGYVGTITAVDKEAIESHLKRGRITILSPLGVGSDKQIHNVNADEVASAIASTLEAEKFVLLTDVQGVLREINDPNSLISTLKMTEVESLIQAKVIVGGMIPKVQACMQALRGNVRKAHIIDARIAHALLLEIFTDLGIGTQILKS